MDVVRVKSRSVAATRPGQLIRRRFVYPPDRDCHLQEEITKMMRERMAIEHRVDPYQETFSRKMKMNRAKDT
jgi:hypothetical protein